MSKLTTVGAFAIVFMAGLIALKPAIIAAVALVTELLIMLFQLSAILCGAVFGLVLIGVGALLFTLFKEDQREDRKMTVLEQDASTTRQIAEVRSNLVYAGDNGMMPVSMADVLRGVVRDEILLLQSQMIDAQRTHPNVPNSIHYSVKNDTENYGGLLEDGQQQLSPLGPNDVPTFGEAIQRGMVSPGQVFTGWDVMTHEPVTLGGLEHIESLVFAGESTSGKSNSARVILCQLAMMGGKILLSDRHAGHERSLAFGMGALHNCLARPIAKTPEATVELVNYAYQEFMTRVEEVDRDHRALVNHDPLILVIDEFTALMKLPGMFDQLYDILNTLIIEAAKYKILVQLIGQNWSSVSTGGRADLRQSFQSRMVHKMDSEQARLMISTEASRLSEELPKGQAFLKDATGRTHFVQMPLCTAADIELALGECGQWAVMEPFSNVPAYLPSNVPHNVPDDSASNVPEDERNIDGNIDGNMGRNISGNIEEQRRRRVVLALQTGKTVTDITRDIYGIQGSGRASQEASREINEIIADEFLGAMTEEKYASLDELGLMFLGAVQDGQTINDVAESFGRRPSKEYMAALDGIYGAIRQVIA